MPFWHNFGKRTINVISKIKKTNQEHEKRLIKSVVFFQKTFLKEVSE